MTTEPTCPVCEAVVYNNDTICNRCRNRLETCLLETGSLMRDLDVTLCKQSKVIHNHASTELDPTPTVFHVGASNAGHELRMMLGTWCTLILDGTGHKFTNKPTPVNLAAYIVHHLHWLAQHEAAPDAVTELTDAYHAVEQVIDVDPETRIVGVCGHDTETGPCPQTLWAHLYASTVQCRTCGQLWDVRGRRLESYAQAFTTAADPPTITRAFKTDGIALTTDRIRQWARRGLLEPVRPNRYVVAHVARLLQLSEAGTKLTVYNEET